MTKNKSALIKSLIALMLSVSMLVGTTFAWFTDSVRSNNNIIVSGNIDVEMYWTDDLDNGTWHNVEDPDYNTIFSYDNWEPGYTDVKYIKIKNAGSLALNYKLAITPETAVGKLAEVINVHYATDAVKINDRTDLQNTSALGLLSNVLRDDHVIEGTLMAEGQQNPYHPESEVILTLAMTMITTAGNDYQNETAGSFGITALATQAPYEEDSFGANYDSAAELPIILSGDTVSADVENLNGATANDVTLRGAGVSATIPAGTLLENGADRVTLMVTPLEKTTSDITVVNGEILIPVDVHVDGVSEDNTTPIVVNLGQILPKGLNMGNYTLYHVEDGTNKVMTLVNTAADLSAHNTFTYDPVTGEVSVAMSSFSEVTVVADTVNEWNGDVADAFSGGTGAKDDPYIIANADQLAYLNEVISKENAAYGDKNYKLIADVNLGGSVDNSAGDPIFYPIGYHKEGVTTATAALDDENPEAFYIIEEDTKLPANMAADDGSAWYTYGGAFSGTFDGNGHKVSNIYQNTWSMKGNYDGHYWNAAMGLFGYVYGGTVKNLTVDNFSSDGEFTPTGVIAAYAANSTFENIAITNCNPRVYNTGNGGIVGIGGNSSDPDTYNLTFNNITIDNTNKITALWGSWDVACGGLVGMFRGAGHAYMTNCHVAAQIDVYNDVCGNYQYYWYRYSGMMIGTNKNMTTDKDGYTVPETSKFHAQGCTVHFGEWNDYYYCELVANSLASYTHDHQFSRLEQISSLDEIKSGNTWTKTGNYLLISGDTKTCYHIVKDSEGKLKQHEHDDAGKEIVDGKEIFKEDKRIVYLPFNQLFTGYGWGVKHIPVYNGDDYAFEGITILDRELADSVEKFETKFTGNFLYRVGNQNTVSLGTLFEAKDGVTINNSGVWVSIDKVDENSNVSGTFTANTNDWTKGTIKFSGTGVVKLTIQDYDYCKPTTLTLEVVDAVNATGAVNATANNVVLLNDCGFGSLEVSGGYTLFGNGFTMTCSSDSVATDRMYSFVELKSGTLDNVKIVTPNFSHAIMYEKNKTENGNPSATDSSGRTRYYNIRSAVLVSASSNITNSYISGGRAAIYATSGTLNIKNSTIYGGAVANIQTEASNNLVLEDVTLVQKPIKANVNDTSKTIMGLSVVNMCDTEGKGAKITLKGYLHQYAWANSEYKKFVPSDAQNVVDEVLGKTNYVHQITYSDDATRDSVNLGFVNMPEGLVATETGNINEENFNFKTSYDWQQVSSIASIYTYGNGNGTDDAVKTEPVYSANKQGHILPILNYTDINEDRIFTTTYDTIKNQWKSTLKVDVDAGEYSFSFDKLLAQKNGKNLEYTVKTEDNKEVSKNTQIALNSAVSNTYILTITDDQIYDKNGNKSGTTTHSYLFELVSTKTSLPVPTWISTTLNGTPYIVVDSKDGDWNCAVPVLDGFKVKYWSKKQNKEVELNLADVVSAAGLSAGLQNAANNTVTITVADEYTLTVTTTGFKTNDNGKPVVVGGKLYFTVSSSSNYVSTKTTDRTVSISYKFTDANNSAPISHSGSFNVVYATYKSKQYKYSDFCNGTLTEASSCVTPDTLITLADGSKVRVDSLKGDEELLVWNMETGKLDKAPIMFVDSDPEAEYEVIKLHFSDGTEVKVISEHGFWDYDLNRYVYLDRNAADYIGHTFAKQGADGLEKVVLTDVVIETEVTTAWSPVTVGHLCYFTNDMLSMPGGVGGLFNIFEVDANTMTYDYEALARDIETYGLFTYEEVNAIAPLTEEMFYAAGGQYLKISIGKGNMTEAELAAMITRYSKYI